MAFVAKTSTQKSCEVLCAGLMIDERPLKYINTVSTNHL
jgi:hypothetical protein